MNYQAQTITENEIHRIFGIEENHFNDFKAKDLSGNKFCKIVSAFAKFGRNNIKILNRRFVCPVNRRKEALLRFNHRRTIRNREGIIQKRDSESERSIYYFVEKVICSLLRYETIRKFCFYDFGYDFRICFNTIA